MTFWSGSSLLVFFLTLAAASGSDPVVAFDRVVRVPAMQTQGLTFVWKGTPGTIDLQFAVGKGGSPVRILLIARADQERLLAGREVNLLARTDYGDSGRLRARLDKPGEYVAVVDNRAERRQAVIVRVTGVLRHEAWVAGEVRELSGRVRAVVVSVTTLVFGLVVWLAGRPVWKAMRGRWPMFSG